MNKSSKESGKSLSGMFKKSPKLDQADKNSQEDLSTQSELSGSTSSLSKTKESSGILGRMFRRSPKPFESRSQEDLSGSSELLGSTDDLSENHSKEKGTFFGGMFKKRGAKYQSQEEISVDDDLSGGDPVPTEQPVTEHEQKEKSGLLKEQSSPVQKPKSKRAAANGMKSTFYTEIQENVLSVEPLGNGENKQSHKQSKLAGAVSKLNPFRSTNKHEKQTGSDDDDSPAGSRQISNDKQVKSNETDPDMREKSETPSVPPRPTEEEMKRTSIYNKVKPSKTEDKKKSSNTNYEETFNNEDNPPSHKQNSVVEAISKLNPFRSANNRTNENIEAPKETAEELEQKPDQVKSNVIQQEWRVRHQAPPVPPRPTEEEIRGVSPNKDKPRKTKDKESNPREKKEDPVRASMECLSDAVKKEESVQRDSNENYPESKEAEDEDKDSSLKEYKKEDCVDKDKTKTKVKKPKKNNPFMPRVKAKVKQRNAEERAAGNAAENEGANRSLFDQLEDFRVDPRPPEDNEDVEDLMEWWNAVESWEDTPQDDDMTEKEEAKAFAVTAEKVQKGIRVFNKLFSERGESLWQHIMDLNAIADCLDKFNKNTKIAQITGGSTSAIGGVATITGLALAPFTMGTSLIVTAVGLGVATAGGLTSAGAGISNQVNNSMDRKKVEKIVEDYQEKIADFNKCLKFIKQGIDNLRKFNLLKMKNHAYNQDFPALTSSFYEDGAMAGKAILINANEIMRVVQIANVAGSTAARAVQVASMATGVLTGLFVGMDIYFVAKDSKILKKGAKSEFAAKIREVVEQLHDGLVELNTIRMELQSTQPEDNTDDDGMVVDDKKMKGETKNSADEDEIDQIKKQIKKDIENREYV